jgi:hypothetical protein
MNYSVENIRVEMSYGDQRLLSRVTTDLEKTGNKEVMNDKFRFYLNDMNMHRGAQIERKIKVRAFDIDYAIDVEKNAEGNTQTLVGESGIDTITVRKHLGKEFHYHCGIRIKEEHFSQKAMKV